MSGRRRVAEAAVAAEAMGCVFAVDVIPTEQEPTERWALDLLVVADDEAISTVEQSSLAPDSESIRQSL